MSKWRRGLLITGVSFVCLFIAWGVYRTLPTTPLPGESSCMTQDRIWFDQVTPVLGQLQSGITAGNQTQVRESARMLWPIPPPQCKTNHWKWQRLMERLAHNEPLSPSMARYMLKLTAVKDD